MCLDIGVTIASELGHSMQQQALAEQGPAKKPVVSPETATNQLQIGHSRRKICAALAATGSYSHSCSYGF